MTRAPTVALLVVTDGRVELLSQTIASFEANVCTDAVTSKYIWDDSGSDDHFMYLQAAYRRLGYTPIRGIAKAGFGGSVRGGWQYLLEHTEEPYFFHLEDDFTFNTPVRLADMVRVASVPHICQAALKRQPWGAAEEAAGGFMEMHPDEYSAWALKSGLVYVTHRLFWTTNPSVFRREVAAVGWPDGDGSEAAFAAKILSEGFGDVPGFKVRMAYLGNVTDPPLVTHTGTARTGHGY